MVTKENRTPAKVQTAGKTVSPRLKAASPVKSGVTAPEKKTAPRKKVVRTRTGSGGSSAVQKKQQRSAPKRPTPDVVYTQPGPFNRNRFILHLATVVAAVLALIFGVSIFFNVDSVTVSGNEKYTSWEVLEASGIKIGDNLLGLNEARISSNIISRLPYVASVRMGIKLPDTVKIEIEELAVLYSVEADDGSWWLMRADGRIVEKTNSTDAELHTRVLGVQITGPVVGEKAVAAQPVPQETTADGQLIPVTVNAKEQLDVAISVQQYLEDCGIIGNATSLDVSDLSNLELWYGTRYQVQIGDTTQLRYKISSMKAAIDELGEYQSGVLDVSFTTWPNEVGFTPFG